MTPQESQALQTLLSQLVEVRGIEKDQEADAMIRKAVSQQPDAAYLLAQRSLILEQAVEAAKQRIAALERQIALPASSGSGRSFLDANAWGRSSTTAAGSATPGYQSAHFSQDSMRGIPGRQGGFLRGSSPGMFGGGGSFLGTMAATAAGVAGGAFLFQGLGNLLDGNDSPQADSSAATDGTPDQAADAQAGSLAEEPGANNDIASTEDYAADDSFIDDGGMNDDASFG